jgi:integrase/recombinase XerC
MNIYTNLSGFTEHQKKNRKWAEEFLRYCINSNKSEFTYKNYRADLYKFLNWFEKQTAAPIIEANAETISLYQEYLAQRDQQNFLRAKSLWRKIIFWWRQKKQKVTVGKLIQYPLSTNSRRRHLSTLKNFFEFLKQTYEDDHKIFQQNPIRSKLHTIKVKETDISHTSNLSFADFTLIKKIVFNIKDQLAIELLYYGGLRIAELVGLKYEDFNDTEKVVRLERKGGYVHHLPLQNYDYIKKLIDLAAIRHPHRYLFIGRENRSLSTRAMYNHLTKIINTSGCAGRNLSPHSFRKGCAGLLYQKTKDLLLVRDYLNHSDAKVTQTYIELS